jgi:hypothetical protein
MSLIDLLIALLVICVLGYVAYWIITKFFPEPMRTPALAITGVLLLIILLVAFFPGAGSYRIWR